MRAIPTTLCLSVLLVACAQPDTVTGDTVATSTTTGVPQATSAPPAAAPTANDPPVVVVFSATAGFRHGSIEAGIAAIEEIGYDLGFAVEATEDGAVLAERLGATDVVVVVFVNTTGDVLDEAQEEAMETWLEDGGGFVGIHSATDTEYEWEWYGGLVGAYFSDHPAVQEATVNVVAEHPLTAGLSASFQLEDEWYNFRNQPDESVAVLAEVDESTYEGGTMGDPHPIAWAHEYEAGRSVYLGFGHEVAVFSEFNVRRLLRKAIGWAAGNS